jgi:hypothetical protein
MVTSPLQAAEQDQRGRCDERRSTTLRENKHVRVYAYQPRDSVGRGVVVCRKWDGRHLVIDEGHTPTVFAPPAIDLAGTVVGFAEEDCFEPECSTRIVAFDTRRIPRRQTSSAVPGMRVVNPGRPDRVRIGALQVRRNFALAWIVCRGSRNHNLPTPDEPVCNRRRVYNNVFKSDAGTKRGDEKRLDWGRGIPAASLKLEGSRLTWTHGKQRRSATLR